MLNVSDTLPPERLAAVVLQLLFDRPLLSTTQFLGKPRCVCLTEAQPHSLYATGAVQVNLTQVQSAEDLAAFGSQIEKQAQDRITTEQLLYLVE